MAVSESFTDLLKQAYIDRKRRNPSYSERAFARDIELSPGFLKLLFQGKKSISIRRAEAISRKLNWTEFKVRAALQRLHRQKGEAYIRPVNAENAHLLSMASFSLISDWYYFAILELCDVYQRGLSLRQVCRAYGLSALEAGSALKELETVGLLRRQKRQYFKVKGTYEVKSQSVEVVRKYHRQILAKAVKAVDHQDYSEREYAGVTLSFSSDRMDEAREAIQSFVQEFNAQFIGGSKDNVYQLELAFFSLKEE
jgi:uncharacterized protein (TIGR02147 family)